VEREKIASLRETEEIVAKYPIEEIGIKIEIKAATCEGELIPGRRSASIPPNTPIIVYFRKFGFRGSSICFGISDFLYAIIAAIANIPVNNGRNGSVNSKLKEIWPKVPAKMNMNKVLIGDLVLMIKRIEAKIKIWGRNGFISE